MFIVVTPHRVLINDKLSAINKELDAAITIEEMTVVGADYITRMDDIDIDFVRDKKRMSGVFFGNFFKRDKKPLLFALIAAVTGIINLLVVSNILTMLQAFIKACGG